MKCFGQAWLWCGVAAAVAMASCTEHGSSHEQTPSVDDTAAGVSDLAEVDVDAAIAVDSDVDVDSDVETDDVGASSDSAASELSEDIDLGVDLEIDCQEAAQLQRIDFNVAASADIFRFRRVHVLQSAQAYRDYTGQEPPSDLDFASEWVAVFGRRSWYGRFYDVSSLAFCDQQQVQLEVVEIDAGEGCERPALISWGGFLARFAALDDPLDLDMSGSSHGSLAEFSCDASSAPMGARCTQLTLCQPGLVCGGLTRQRDGLCVSADALHEVKRRETVPIPDGESTPAESALTLSGLPGGLHDVVAEVWIAHPSPSDVRISLRSPTGEREVIWDHETSRETWEQSTDWAVQRAAVELALDAPNGDWTLEIVDDVPGHAGQLEGWSLKVLTR